MVDDQMDMPTPLRHGLDGSSWYNARPTSEEFAEWFRTKVKIHDGMDHDDWVSGIALLADTVSSNEPVGAYDDGRPILNYIDNLVLTPYAKYETRLAYFWAWMALNPEWLGVIEAATQADDGLPPGMRRMSVDAARVDGAQRQDFLICSKRVRIYERDSVEYDGLRIKAGRILHQYPEASKQQPLYDRHGNIDQAAIQKAESGAIGRALGFAGVLVLPGGGAGTAEEMVDAQQARSAQPAPAPAGPRLPVDVGPTTVDSGGAPTVLMVSQLIEEAKVRAPAGAFAEFQKWYAEERRFPAVSQLDESGLKAVERKVRKVLDGVPVS